MFKVGELVYVKFYGFFVITKIKNEIATVRSFENTGNTHYPINKLQKDLIGRLLYV